MMKKAIIFFILFCAGNWVFSQETDSKENTNSFYEISLALSKPQGEFKYSDISNNVGYALNGGMVSISACNYGKSFIGIRYSAALFINPVPEDFYKISIVSEYTSLQVGSWSNINFGIGPVLHYDIGNIESKTYFEAGVLIGMISANRPSAKYNKYEDGSLKYSNRIKKGFGLGFSVLPEISFYTKVSENNYLKVFANYLIAPSYIEYKSEHFHYNEDNEIIIYVNDYQENYLISALNVGIGVTF